MKRLLILLLILPSLALPALAEKAALSIELPGARLFASSTNLFCSNMVAGAGITLSYDANGKVTVTSTGSGTNTGVALRGGYMLLVTDVNGTNVASLNTNSATADSALYMSSAGVVMFTNRFDIANNAAKLYGVLPLAGLPSAVLTNRADGTLKSLLVSNSATGVRLYQTNTALLDVDGDLRASTITAKTLFLGDAFALTNLNGMNIRSGSIDAAAFNTATLSNLNAQYRFMLTNAGTAGQLFTNGLTVFFSTNLPLAAITNIAGTFTQGLSNRMMLLHESQLTNSYGVGTNMVFVTTVTTTNRLIVTDAGGVNNGPFIVNDINGTYFFDAETGRYLKTGSSTFVIEHAAGEWVLTDIDATFDYYVNNSGLTNAGWVVVESADNPAPTVRYGFNLLTNLSDAGLNGEALVASSVNSNKLDAATLAMLGSGGASYQFMPTNLAAGLVVTNGTTVFNGTNLASLQTTNALGAEINVALAGAVPGGFDNQILFSNLLAAGGSLYFPPGDWASSPVIKNEGPPSFIRGAGDGSVWRNLGATNTWALKLIAADCTVRNLQINPNQTVPPRNAGYCSISDSPYTNNISNLGGGLWISAVGFPVVENVYFVSNAATAIYFEGWRDIGYRSNHLSLVNIRAWRNYNALVGGATNANEYCMLDGFTASENVNYTLSIEDANFIAMGLNINGWQDGNGTFGTVTGTGLRYRSRAGRGHTKLGPGQVNHVAFGIDAVGDGAMENLTLTGINFGGSSSNVIRGFAQMDVAFCHFEGYSVLVTTNAGAATNSISWPIPSGNTIIGGGTIVSNIGSLHWQNNYVKGLIHDGIGRRIFHYGEPNWLAGTGRDTNDYVSVPKAQLGLTAFKNTASASGGSDWALYATTGNAANQGVGTDGIVRGANVFASASVGIEGQAAFKPANSAYAITAGGSEMVLSHASGNVRADLGVEQFQAGFANGSFNVTSNNAGKVVEYTNTASAKGYVITTNADEFVGGDSIVRGFQTNHNTLAISNELQSLASPLKVRPGSGQGRVSILQWPGDVGVGAIKLNSAAANTTNYSLRADGSAGDSTLVSGGGAQGLELQYYARPHIIMSNFSLTRFETNIIFDGGFVAFTTVRASAPSITEIGGTNIIADWMSNGFPPVRFSSVYHAANTNTAATTNFGLPLPGP